MPSDTPIDQAAAAQAQAKFLEGWAQHQRGQIGRALAVDPNNVAALYNHGNALNDLGRHEEAIARFDAAIRLDPAQAAEPYNNRGNALWALKRHEAALESFDKSLRLNPNFAEAHNNRGNALRDLKQFDAAVAAYDKAIALKPDYAEAFNNRGNAQRDLKQYDAAVASFDKAIALRPAYAEAFNNRGNALRDLKRHDDALADYDRAIALKGDYADAHYNRGITLRALKRFEDAVEAYNHVIVLKPDCAEAFSSRGLARASLKQFQAAIDDYNRAIDVKPDYAEAYNNRGYALSDMRRHEEAMASYAEAIRIKPDYPEAYNNAGVSLKELNRLNEALASHDQAIAIKPDSSEAHYNRGIVLNDMKRYGDAIAAYGRALEIKPSYAFLYGLRLYTKLNICDWHDLDREIAELLERIARGEAASPPFSLLNLIGAPEPLQKTAEIWTKTEFPRASILGPIPARPLAKKPRIGYFSMDFHNHPVSQLLAGVIEAGDRTKFETIAFSYGPDTDDDVRKRMKAAFDQFVDVRNKSDQQITELARHMEIDIAVDLAGYTGQPRTGIFAMGAAPIQVNYLGYPGTMGADYYDYIIADRVLIPEADRHFYTEQTVYMPHCYQPNDCARVVSDKTFSRAELGLPANGFVYCCFNNAIKFSPKTFDSWMRILKRVPGSVLWLLQDNPAAGENLRAEAMRRGIDASRLVFAPRMPFSDNLARQRAADLFLDTLPYNAHTTASDALWAGLPVLTCLGESFAGRVAASILTTLEMPELIAPNVGAFEDRAVALAEDRAVYEQMRQTLGEKRLTAPLFDAALYARHLEAAYTAMADRSHAGLPPTHISL